MASPVRVLHLLCALLLVIFDDGGALATKVGTAASADLLYKIQTPPKPKICIGTSGRMSVPGNRTMHYQNLRDRYTNCTYVDGNLELTWLQDEGLDLTFLQYIREVTGYVLISRVDVPRLVLPSLQIIRGRTLFKLNVRDEDFSLMVTLSQMLSVEMPALRDILAGSAGSFNNYNLCHVKSLNWDEILTGPGAQFVYVYDFKEPERNCSGCHAACPAEGGCWGPGADNCQRLSKINCSPQCHGGRCFGPEPRQCCHLFCAGGCTGPTQSDCLACRNFYDNGVCKQECPHMMRYNSITYSWEPNPEGKFAYGATCVKQCPEHLLRDSSACVRACPPNKKAVGGECVPCNGPCPKTCEIGKNERIHAGNIDRFKNCTILQGSLQVLQHSFEGYQEVYENYSFGPHHGKLHPSKLQVFSTVKEITGFVNIDADHEDFTDLSFLRSLEVIGGRYLHEFFSALYIVKTSLRSLGLHSLKKIRSGGVLIVENSQLCFAEGINWKAFISGDQKEQSSYDITVDTNRNASLCAAEGQVCHQQCTADGCWGPGADSCIRCRQFRVGTSCVQDCDHSLGMFQSSADTCDLCDPECEGPCRGKGPDKCHKCRHVRDGPYCVARCPDSKYSSQGECQPCHENCDGGCSGPGNTVGAGGCVSCRGAVLDRRGAVERCLGVNESCPEGHYFEFIGPFEQGQLRSLAGKGACRKCHERCKTCIGFGFHVNVCTECMHYRNGEQCEDACLDGFYANESTHECMRCAGECRGCDGPGQNCTACRNYRLYLDAAEAAVNGSGFLCTAHCPDSHPHKVFPEDGDDPFCSAEPGAQPVFDSEENVTIAIVSAVVTAVVLLVIVTAVCCKCRSDRKKEAMVKMTILMSKEGLNEPLKVTNVKPNLAKLRIVKEAELRKGGILGYGAFGTVYRGVWVPADEHIKIPVAIKVLRDDTGADTNKEILDEAYIMASLDHPNLLPLLAICLTSQLMLVTQLMPLGCLVDYVRNNRDKVGSKPLLNWCAQIARGMCYLEERRLVHRDLAARNVLVQTPSLVKITDFGLAKLLDINEDEYKAAGGKMPIKWLALECIQHRIFNHKSDVWAFGVTVWELLTYGGRPYEDVPAKDVPDLLEKGERLPQPPSCSIEIYMLMIKCWMLDADSRPSFHYLADEFAKMSRDPGRYLVIPGDKLMRLPSYTQQDERELMRSLAASALDSPTDVLMDACEYLNPPGTDHFQPGYPYPASSLATLDTASECCASSRSGSLRGRPRRHTHEEAGRRRVGSAGSGRHPHTDTLRSLRHLDEMGDDDCFAPGVAHGTPGGWNPTAPRAASVAGMRLHLPLDEDDYLMPSNGQASTGGPPGPAYMDVLPDETSGPGGDSQPMLSMDNPEYIMAGRRAAGPGSRRRPNAAAAATSSFSAGGGAGARRPVDCAATATLPPGATYPTASIAPAAAAAAAAAGPLPAYSSNSLPLPLNGALARTPGGGRAPGAAAASSPNAVGLPLVGAGARGSIRRGVPRPVAPPVAPPVTPSAEHDYYNELGKLPEATVAPSAQARRSETTV